MKNKLRRAGALLTVLALLMGQLPSINALAVESAPASTAVITKGKWALNCGKQEVVTSYGLSCNNSPNNSGSVTVCRRHGARAEYDSGPSCRDCGENHEPGITRCPRGCLTISHWCRLGEVNSSGSGFTNEYTYHTHVGSPSTSGGCYTTPIYAHIHTGSEAAGGGCYTQYIPAVSFIDNSGATGTQPAPITSVAPGQPFKFPTNTFVKSGFHFVGWSTGAGQPLYQPGQTLTMPSITSDIVYAAVWEANTAAYRVEHYQQDLSGNTYTLKDQQTLEGMSGATVTAAAKSYTGFHENTGHAQRVPSGQIAAGGGLVLRLYYDRDMLAVTFESNGGNSVPSQNGILYGGVAIEPIPPAKTGYDFQGWYDQTLMSLYPFNTPLTVGITLYAKWDARTDTPYQVKHYRQDVVGDGYTLFETDHLEGTTDAAVTAAAKIYTGFHENTTNAGRVPSGQVAPAGDLVLALYYDRDTYTVTFDSNGGSPVAEQTGVRYEAAATEPSEPNKMGYTFCGWHSDEGLTTSYSFTAPVTEDLTLYAKWEPRTDTAYQVEHYRQDIDGDGYTLFETDHLEGTTDAFITATPKPYAGFHENTTHAGRTPGGQVAPAGDLVLKLYYDRETYTVDFESNGGNDVAEQPGIRYEAVAAEPQEPSKTGYTFCGWYSDEVLTTPYSFADPVTEDRTLYAKWEPRTDTAYRVEHYQQDIARTGYALFAREELTGTTDATVEAAVGSYPGFHENTAHAERLPDGQVAPDGSLVLKRYYDRDSYTVTFDPNGGELEPVELPVFYGCEYGPLPTPAREKHQFVGWYASPDDRLPVTSNTPVAALSDHTLTAVWVALDYGVVDGTVEYPDGLPAAGVQITIRAGNVDYLSTVTDAEGRFSITDVAYGHYNLVSEKDGVTVTSKLDLFEKHATLNVRMPKGKTNSVVEVLGDAPELVVGGLDALFEAPEIYTPADEAMVAGGGLVELKMTIEPLEPAGEEAAKLATITTDPVAVYLSVTVDKTTRSADGASSSSSLSELPWLLELYLPFPVLPGCSVLRIHDGEVEKLTEDPNQYGEYIELENGIILLHVSRFSTYAVTVPSPPEPDPGGQNTAVGEREEKPKPTAAEDKFYVDVQPDDWFYDAVMFVTEHGLMAGTGERRFSPRIATTRGMIVTILWRMEGKPGATGSLAFPDVDPAGYCAGAVAWAHETGLVLGYDNGLYGPNDPITREQLALILYRRFGEQNGGRSILTLYPDGDTVSEWAAEAVAWAVKSGLMRGNEGGYLMPQSQASRAEVAALIQRLMTQ